MVELTTLRRPNVRIYAKLEGANPGGSIKDRIGMWLVWNASESWELTKEKILIEATSGNTGVGLSLACEEFGYRCRLYVPSTISQNKINKMKSYGADIVKVDGTIDDCIMFVEHLSRYDDKYYWSNQFDNIQCIECHYKTTGPEIHGFMLENATNYRKMKTINILVCAMGTTGTIMGCSRYLLSNPAITWMIIGVMPTTESKIEGLKNLKIQRRPRIYNQNFVDKIYYTTDKIAIREMQSLARNEQICAGISSGAALHVAKLVANKYSKMYPKWEINVCVILPDTGLNYTEAFK